MLLRFKDDSFFQCNDVIYIFDNKKLDNFIDNVKMKSLYAIKLFFTLKLNKSISDKELFELVKKLFDVSYSLDDILKYLEINNNKEYKLKRIKTNVVSKEINSEGHGRDFSWWEEYRQLYFNCAIEKDFSYDFSKPISTKELEKLVNDGKVILINKSYNIVYPETIDFETETINNASKLLSCIDSYNNIENDEMIKYFVNIIKKSSKETNFLDEIKDLILYNHNFMLEYSDIISDNKSDILHKDLTSKNPLDIYFNDENKKKEYIKSFRIINKL